MLTYYNDNDGRCCVWLRELIKKELITNGHIDERDIREISGSNLFSYQGVHFFAGIGGWDYALQLAGWPAELPVWTGSCPCQPFSCAGKRAGTNDHRHLWPEFFRLISECRPPIVFGEQVASADGRKWLDGIRTDLETLGYAVGAADLCAASVGAPHIRQRLYWMAHTKTAEWWRSKNENIRRRWIEKIRGSNTWSNRMVNPNSPRCKKLFRTITIQEEQPTAEHTGNNYWSDFKIAPCGHEQKRIPIEPAFYPLVNGFPARVGLLRGYGNAIVPQVAAEFIGAAMDVLGIESC